MLAPLHTPAVALPLTDAVPDFDPDHTSPSETPGRSTATDTADGDLHIRPLASPTDYQACVAVQNEVWGPGYGDIVPASLLQVMPHVGGLVIGAFTPEDELVGFVFGITGLRDGVPVHWSHMLGVRETARNAGVGRMLKEYQRAELARMGVAEMHWTFDPLVAKNAHLNLNRLGARVVEYVRDMYGTTGSPLHYGSPTDRLVVAWPTDPGRDRAPDTAPPAGAPILTPHPRPGDARLDPVRDDESDPLPHVRIEIPRAIQQVIARSPAEAGMWRAAVREYFEWALERGYIVTGLERDPVTSRVFYTLALERTAR